jgi:hypothetical protein
MTPNLAPLEAAARSAIMDLTLLVGTVRASDLLEVSVVTMARGCAGHPLQRATRTHLYVMLEKVRPEIERRRALSHPITPMAIR